MVSTSILLVPFAQSDEEFQELDVEPDKSDEQAEGCVPFHVFGGALLHAIFDEVKIEYEIEGATTMTTRLIPIARGEESWRNDS